MALFGGLFGGGSASDVYIPPQRSASGIGQTEQNVLGGIQGLGQYQTYDIPGAQQVTNRLMNNTGAGQYMQGAGVAGQLGQQAALSQYGAGGDLYGMGGRVGQTAFDPQNALYARTQQQLTDQARASQAARGIQTSPYGAGLEDQQMRNFNIDWQNQQLQRQLAGLQGVGQAYGQASQMQGQAPGQYLQASMMPYGAEQQVGRDQMQNLAAMGQFGQQAAGIPGQQIGAYQNYLGYGNNVEQLNNQRAQLELQKQQQDFGQNSAIWGGLGKAAGTALGWGTGGGSTLGGTAIRSMFG